MTYHLERPSILDIDKQHPTPRVFRELRKLVRSWLLSILCYSSKNQENKEAAYRQSDSLSQQSSCLKLIDYSLGATSPLLSKSKYGRMTA